MILATKIIMRYYFEGLAWRRAHHLLYGLGTIQKKTTFPLPTIPCLTNYAILDRHAKVILTLSKPPIVDHYNLSSTRKHTQTHLAKCGLYLNNTFSSFSRFENKLTKWVLATTTWVRLTNA
jgi:hypothetical protein